ncbi:tyrosine-type recombinase/integrase [Salinisphaera hydrothermalis]|uniref:Phage integrase family protein n=1 Tax=Salinisphaera hydrothermalis (strain C41B8) TaxID=1304275 RepID=A0A084INF3_SALHC|nr:integrase arm-type DNA-binding domain-containing protein [Salinisphaera hydrothermalis]KEZ78237.1 phage integrase family protein [Salinisphaera hydrothermalis C41B8]
MAQNLLSVRKIEAAQPQPKAYLLRDGGSLFLRVQPNGSKLWWFRYRLGGVAQTYSIGIFPKVTLEAARTERDWARGLVKKGLDPILEKKSQIAAQVDSNEQTFEVIARDWMRANSDWSDYYAKQVENYLTKDVFPKIGRLPITSIKASHLRPVIKVVEARGAQSVAILIRQWVGQIFRYAAANGICEYDPTSLLKGLVKRPPVRHNPPLKWAEVPVFLNKLNGWSGFRTTEIALRLVALTFVRTVEIRRATWDQFDLDSAIWEVPAKNMKMRRPHLVFLSKQAVALLRELETLTGAGQLLFPNNRRPKEPMSATTLNRVLERLGYGGQFSTHGFRSTATTILGLLGYPENRVDLQLAHQKKKDTSRASYDHTKYVSSRRMIMQDWADILDALERGDSVDKITKDFGPMSKRRAALLKIIERE